jgi:serine/threonine protein kinase
MRDISVLRTNIHDMLCGLAFLHKNNIHHRDIKPENVLMGKDGECKLADFGVSSLLDPDVDIVSTRDGTPLFFAPEMVKGTSYHGKPCDVWALGVTIYILAFNRKPFPTTTLPLLLKAIESNDVCCPPCAPQLLCDLIYRMLAKEPSLRITAHNALGHPFLSDRVPMSLSVRVWKENKLSRLPENEITDAFMSGAVVFQDTRDKTARKTVNLDVLAQTPLATSLEVTTPRRLLPKSSPTSPSSPNSPQGFDKELFVNLEEEGLNHSFYDEANSPTSPDMHSPRRRSTRSKSIINPFHDGTPDEGYGVTNMVAVLRGGKGFPYPFGEFTSYTCQGAKRSFTTPKHFELDEPPQRKSGWAGDVPVLQLPCMGKESSDISLVMESSLT